MDPGIAISLRERLESAVRGGSFAPSPDAAPISCGQLVTAFMAHARRYYPARTRGRGEAENFIDAARPVLTLYSDEPADRFLGVQIQACRALMVETGLARSTVNSRVRRIRHIWKWGVSVGLVAPETLMALQAVVPLMPGRGGARESQLPGAIDPRVVELTLAKVHSPACVVIARLQLLTAMRPGEVCAMHSEHIDTTSGVCWVYTPAEHKLKWRGRPREVFMGPAAIEVLRPWMRVGHLFLTRCARPFTTNAYALELRKAALRAGIQPWGPNRLRHTSLSVMRRKFGSELAQFLAGHAKLNTTEIYAERNRAAMVKAAEALTLADVMAFKPRAARTA